MSGGVHGAPWADVIPIDASLTTPVTKPLKSPRFGLDVPALPMMPGVVFAVIVAAT